MAATFKFYRYTSKAGFSLIELICVLSLIILIVVVCVPRFKVKALAEKNLKEIQEKGAFLCEQARLLAVQKNVPVRIEIVNTDDPSCQLAIYLFSKASDQFESYGTAYTLPIGLQAAFIHAAPDVKADQAFYLSVMQTFSKENYYDWTQQSVLEKSPTFLVFVHSRNDRPQAVAALRLHPYCTETLPVLAFSSE